VGSSRRGQRLWVMGVAVADVTEVALALREWERGALANTLLESLHDPTEDPAAGSDVSPPWFTVVVTAQHRRLSGPPAGFVGVTTPIRRRVGVVTTAKPEIGGESGGIAWVATGLWPLVRSPSGAPAPRPLSTPPPAPRAGVSVSS